MAFADLPVTIEHPRSKVVTPETVRQLGVGHVSNDIRQDGIYVAGSIVVEPIDAIELVESKQLVELSAGYQCRLDMTSGISPDGEQFDCIQRDIVPNHIAMLPRGAGRSGPEVAIRVDSAGDEVAPEPTLSPRTRSTNTAALNFKSMTPEQLQARIDSLDVENRQLKADKDRLASENQRLAGANAGLQSTLADKNKSLADMIKGDSKRVDAAAIERVKVLDVAKGIVPTLKCDSLGTDEVRLAVVKAAMPNLELTDRTDSKYVSGLFDGIAAGHATHPALASSKIVGGGTRTDAGDKPEPVVSLAQIREGGHAKLRGEYQPLVKTGNRIVRGGR